MAIHRDATSSTDLEMTTTINNTDNVDADEISKFSALADKWWDRNGEFKPLHDINPLRIEYIKQCADGLSGKKVLDIGCGGGILAESLAHTAQHVTGIDLAQASLKVATKHAQANHIGNIDYQYISAEDYATAHAEQFDVVTCLEMLEHVPEPASIVNSVAQLVKPGGTVVFSTLNRTTKSYLMAILGAEYLLRWVPKGTHEHAKFIRPSELMRMIDTTSLHIEATMGLHFNPLQALANNGYYLSNNNIDVNYFVHCSKRV